MACHDIPKIKNGRVRSTALQPLVLPFPEGTELFYICNEPYRKGKAKLLCRNTKGSVRWTRIQCQLPKCAAPPSVEHATAEAQGDKIGDRVTYRCRAGYRLEGGSKTAVLKCMMSGLWSPNDFRCERIVCDAPVVPPNCDLSLDEGRFEGSVARYRCHEGHRLEGKASRTCRSSGWTGEAPACRPTTCNGTVPVENARIRGTLSSYIVGETRDLDCDDGEHRQQTCLIDGSWSAVACAARQPKKVDPPPVDSKDRPVTGDNTISKNQVNELKEGNESDAAVDAMTTHKMKHLHLFVILLTMFVVICSFILHYF